MKNLIKNSLESISKMSTAERNKKLCELAVKEQFGSILPHEIIELEIIQAIRTENGEIDKVLKNWAEHPELDPRKQ
jgi:hypothetical protein